MTFFKLDLPDADKCPPRILAHLGDSVYELWLRQLMIQRVTAGKLSKVEASHKWTTHRASAAFQVQLLQLMTPELTDSEQALAKRARNSPVSVGRRSQQAVHRQATAFEALVGYWYASNQERLGVMFSKIEANVISGEKIVLETLQQDETKAEES